MATQTSAQQGAAGPTPDDRATADLRAASDAIEALAASFKQENAAQFHEAVDLITGCARSNGTVLVSGLGKSGLIGAKLAATLASLGVASHAVHPSEAAHGDLGRFRGSDVVIALSHSGETQEVVDLAAVLRQDGLAVIAITGGLRTDTPSSLRRLATVTLTVGRVTEAGGEGLLAPTTSTTVTLALGDAIALAAARALNVTSESFAKHHPGGSLGMQLRPVTELLRFRAGVNAPIARDDLSIADALNEAEQSPRRPGALLLTDAQGRLSGIFTDSDLRRLVLKAQPLSTPIAEVMTRGPRCLPHTARGRDAVALVREHRQDEIPVIDDHGRPLGVLDVQDLIAAKLVKDDA